MIKTKENFSDILFMAVDRAIKSEVENLVKGRIEEVKKELDLKVPEIVAGISVSIMKTVDMRIMEDRIVFEIRKRNESYES